MRLLVFGFLPILFGALATRLSPNGLSEEHDHQGLGRANAEQGHQRPQASSGYTGPYQVRTLAGNNVRVGAYQAGAVLPQQHQGSPHANAARSSRNRVSTSSFHALAETYNMQRHNHIRFDHLDDELNDPYIGGASNQVLGSNPAPMNPNQPIVPETGSGRGFRGFRAGLNYGNVRFDGGTGRRSFGGNMPSIDYLDPNLASVEPHQEPVLGRRRNPPQQQMLFGEASTDLFDHNTSMANADDQGGLNKSLDANSAYNPDRRNPRRSPYLDDSPQQIQDRDTELARSLSARGNGDLTQEQLMMICRGSGEGVGRDLLGGSYGSTPIQSNTGENAVEQTHQPRPQPLSINGNQPPTTNEGLSIVAHMRFRRPRIEQEPFVELAEQARMYQEREHQAEESRENDGQTRSTLTNAHEDAPSDIREELMSRVYSLPSELRIMIFEQLLPVRADVTVTYRHGNFYYSVRGPFHSSSPQTLPRWRDIMALADAHDDRWRNEVNGVYRAFWTRNTFEFPNAGTLRRWTESIGRTQRSMITSVVLQISRTDPIWEIVLTLRLLGQSRVLQSLVIRFNIDSLTTTRQNNPSMIAWFREIERYRGLTHFELIPLDNDGRPSTLSNAADRLRRFVMRRRDAGAPAYREENALGRYPLVHTTIYNNYNATELIKWLTAQGTTSAQMSTNLHQLSIQVADRQQRLFDNPPSHDVPPLVPRPRRLARFSRRMQQTATQDDPQINAPSGVNQDASSHRLGDGSTSLSHTKKRKFEDEGDDDNDDDDTEEEWDNKEEE